MRPGTGLARASASANFAREGSEAVGIDEGRRQKAQAKPGKRGFDDPMFAVHRCDYRCLAINLERAVDCGQAVTLAK